MTRIDSVRAATDSAKDSVQHAAVVVAPYADSAKEQAAHYANEARTLLAPKVSKAAQQARVQYDAHLAPRLELALAHVPPKVDEAAQRAARGTRKAAKSAADYTVPRFEHALAAAQPVAEEATARSSAALAALRGQVTAKEIRKLTKKHDRRARAGRAFKGLAVAGLLAGGAYAVWRWWDKQANPDWLVEPPAPTEVDDRAPLTSVDGSGEPILDPEVQAKQADAEADGRDTVDGKDLDDRP
ncbi:MULTISPECIES: DUF5324 family protein [unclassified Streptomyces]|uniref:DUF5324 family protein n=1 Tax=unclassified Streptomyces TaxID=2593676 RepID=UPI0022558FD6|nr:MULTISPECIES: DUF5324 family protein [unclassified Streptomyces]MCX5141450.1 DUF5324 family protein [Streptomyces sp. NBC_00338]WRZ65958.1 DUF5324 family protein [Streptomyces sp. NBC_01257]WSU59970.1 DUF5324 family protein [Streptomyces sp. NBC_01104]